MLARSGNTLMHAAQLSFWWRRAVLVSLVARVAGFQQPALVHNTGVQTWFNHQWVNNDFPSSLSGILDQCRSLRRFDIVQSLAAQMETMLTKLPTKLPF